MKNSDSDSAYFNYNPFLTRRMKDIKAGVFIALFVLILILVFQLIYFAITGQFFYFEPTKQSLALICFYSIY